MWKIIEEFPKYEINEKGEIRNIISKDIVRSFLETAKIIKEIKEYFEKEGFTEGFKLQNKLHYIKKNISNSGFGDNSQVEILMPTEDRVVGHGYIEILNTEHRNLVYQGIADLKLIKLINSINKYW